MIDHLRDTDGADPRGLSRREVLIGGSLALATIAVAGAGGCGTRQATSSLPGPQYPGAGPLTAPVAAGSAAPAVEPVPTGVVPRSDWTRAGVARPSEINPMNGVSRITVHHDGLPPVALRSAADVARRLEQIRVGHISRRPEPFADIGYHFVIDPMGRVWEGRSVRYQGAHVKDNNEHNLGILVLGNFNEQRPSPQALASLDRFVAQQMARYNVPLGRVYTHQELRPTACPGHSLQAYMLQTRSRGGALAMAAGLSRYS
jgi:hypothetical protein